MSLTVIKLGGSLAGAEELSLWLDSIENNSKHTDVIIVPGGGKFADTIRELQDAYHFADAAAHKMALLSMCQYGYYLSELNQKLSIVRSEKALTSNLGKQLPILWLPYALIEDSTELEQSWNVTSDSVALWLASKLNADKLILVKSKDIDFQISEIKNHIKNNDIDAFFGNYIAKFSGEIQIRHKKEYALL